MIPKECKRIAEVDFPIAEVSRHSAREKSIRHGHPSTLHLWWARRPLAACRAMLMALLLPDPCDENCPKEFKVKAIKILNADPPVAWRTPGKTDIDMRRSLLDFIAKFSNWDNSANPAFLKAARDLVKAAHPEETPLVVDPFAGGGSIPLEALRLGCDAFASDLNPVACLILKVMLEDIPRHGPELAEELRKIGKEIKDKAEKELAGFYPKDPDGAIPIAYLWARTVKCESPNCGAEIPLMRSFWLCKKPKRKKSLRYQVIRPKGKEPKIEFEIFTPKKDSEVHGGTVTRAKATCLACGNVLPPERVRAQLSAQKGGADVIFDGKRNRKGGAKLLAVVTINAGEQGRHYRLPIGSDYKAAWKAQKRLKVILDEWEFGGEKGLCPVPDEPTPWQHGHRAIGSPRVYGMMEWGDLYTKRQLLLMNVLNGFIKKIGSHESIQNVLGCILSRSADKYASLVVWNNVGEKVEHVFGRQALPMVWDFCEANPFSGASGGYDGSLEWVLRVVEKWQIRENIGQIQNADACASPLPDRTCSIWYTDPPYYDAVPYSDLSDLFYIWLKRGLADNELFINNNSSVTPKKNELTVTTVDGEFDKPKTRDFFENGMTSAFTEGRRISTNDNIGCVVFAHKTTEGWESLLGSMIRSDWIIVNSWPVATEMGARLNARDTASLATSIHLVCRPRSDEASVGDWGEVHRELPRRVGDWMERLQNEGVRGADLVFACIGPALEIYSRYSKVMDANDNPIPLGGDPEAKEPHERGYLSYVWEAVGRAALEQVLGTAEARARNSASGALEEDARLTALFLWTLQSTEARDGNSDKAKGKKDEPPEDEDEEEISSGKKPKGFPLIFDVVRRFAQPLGIHLPEWEDRIIKTEKGVVYLLPVASRVKQLFGEESAQAIADRIEGSTRDRRQIELLLGEIAEAAPRIRSGKRGKKKVSRISDESLEPRRDVTTLDRVHAAMLLQRGGRANALRALLKEERQRGPDFERLANSLSALYPKGSEEKRLLEAMLQAMPR